MGDNWGENLPWDMYAYSCEVEEFLKINGIDEISREMVTDS